MNYTDEVNAQIIIALLKANNIKKIIASPGTTNMPIVGSAQNDPFFEVYSAIDERSAAYMACGLAQETGEPVVLSCTGATASRNYLPGLTEAFYKKLPIIAITSTNGNENIGNLTAQTLDRSVQPKDAIKYSVDVPIVNDNNSFWYCNLLVNRVIHELKKHGGGPVHINLPTSYHGTFSTKSLPNVKKIDYFEHYDVFPNIPEESKVVIFIGTHKKFTNEEETVLEKFVEIFDAVILSDHTSGYYGKYKRNNVIITGNVTAHHQIFDKLSPDLIIHIGEVSGDYSTIDFLKASRAQVWRVSRDGELRDTFKKLTHVFECDEIDFFKRMVKDKADMRNDYNQLWKDYEGELSLNLPKFSFSNIWIAKTFSEYAPKNSVIHFGILNSLRSNNFFNYDHSIQTASNVGGFGIDGCMSTLIGASLADQNKLYFCVIGDLAFFYDMNVLGNRHLGKNIRIILINNGGGVEFKNYSHIGARMGDDVDGFVAARGHFKQENKENSPAQGWAESLGLKYLSAYSKEEFNENLSIFTDKSSNSSIILECFTNFEEESNSLKSIKSLDSNLTYKGKLIGLAKTHMSNDVKKHIKKFLRR